MESLNLTCKKGQIWGMDLMVATTIFAIALTTFYLYTLNENSGSEEKIEELFTEGSAIANMILSEGIPPNWDEDSVIEIGILSEGKINRTKMDMFYNLSIKNYSRTKGIFNTRFDYFFITSIRPTLQNGSYFSGLGKPGVDKQTITAKNLVRIGRFTVYNSTPCGAELFIWEE